MGFLKRLFGGAPEVARQDRTEFTVMTFNETRGEAFLDVVGEQYYPAAVAAFRKFVGGGAGKAILMREPTNKYDSNAIAVYAWISADANVTPVGHLASGDAVAYHPVFDYLGDRIIGCEAAVAPRRGGAGTDGVVLHLGTPGELIAELWMDDHPASPTHPWRSKSVCFTGFGLSLAGVTLDRDGQALLARLAGCIVAPRVTKKVDVCVATNPRDETGNTAKARDYGIPILSELEFWAAVGLDPSALSQGLGRWAQPQSRAWGR